MLKAGLKGNIFKNEIGVRGDAKQQHFGDE